MDETEFEGTIVLEKLAGIGKLDDFWEAVDSDDFGRVKSLMQKAKVDNDTIIVVLKKMSDTDSEH